MAASARARATGFERAERVRRVEAAPPITQAGNVIRIGDTQRRPDLPQRQHQLRARRARKHRINAQTGSGSQEIGSVDGPVRAQTGSGNIRIERAGGSLHAQTGSGNIQAASVGGEVRAQTGSGSVEVRQIARADVSVQTGSGSVTLSLPPDAAYTLDAHTGSGSISTAQPLTVQGQSRPEPTDGHGPRRRQHSDVRTGSGSIDIR